MTLAKPLQELIPLKPLSNLLNRVILLGAGAGLIAWGLSLTANRITLVTATKAFVNGKIITFTSPINGKIQAKANLDSGKQVTDKQLLLKVNEPLSNTEWLQKLKFEIIADQAKLESIENKIREVAQLNQNQQAIPQKNIELEIPVVQEVAVNQQESEIYKTPVKAAIALAEQNVRHTEIELKIAEGHAQVAKSKYDKYRFLENQGAMSTLSVEEVYNNWKVAQEQVDAAKVRIETARLHLSEQQKLSEEKAEKQKLQSRTQQTVLKKVSVPQNNPKTETLNPELAELQRQKNEIEVSIQAKQVTLAQFEKSAIEPKNYPILANSTGVLWEVMVQDGEQVRSGQPLLKQLNCQQIWVEAFVNIDDLKRMEIGSPAQVELYGKNLKMNGRVKTIRSPLSNEQKLGQDVAVTPPEMKNQQLAQVRIELENPQELFNSKQSSAQFCQVGQVAKVNIGHGDSLLAKLTFW
jgi:multidrug resistance efflux pump